MSHTFQQIAPTDHFGWHKGYMDVYHRLFQTVGPGSVLEIGCDGGGGILSYADYFSRVMQHKRQYISCDISPKPGNLDLYPEITHHQGNAYAHDFISEVLQRYAPYAVIVEDGPHTLGTQMFFAEHYPQMLSKDGIAIIEDIQAPEHVSQIVGKIPAGFTTYAIDLRWADDRYDSLLICIQRK